MAYSCFVALDSRGNYLEVGKNLKENFGCFPIKIPFSRGKSCEKCVQRERAELCIFGTNLGC